MKIFWTRHALERQKLWQKEKGITITEVEKLLQHPEQVVEGDRGVQIAQTKRGNGLLRVAFKETEDGVTVITLYWTSKISKYWKE